MTVLNDFRTRINEVDAQIVQQIGQRLAICREVAAYKQQHGIAMMQPQRVREVKQRCVELGRAHGLDEAFVEQLYTLIIGEACRIEEQLMGE